MNPIDNYVFTHKDVDYDMRARVGEVTKEALYSVVGQEHWFGTPELAVETHIRVSKYYTKQPRA